jgi:hypothetical protein
MLVGGTRLMYKWASRLPALRDGVVAILKHPESGQTCVPVGMHGVNAEHSPNIPTAFPAALAPGAHRRYPDNGRRALSRRRRPGHRHIVGALGTALLALATPTSSTAQYNAPGAAIAPGPAPAGVNPTAEPVPPWRLFNRVQIDLGYTYDDNVTRGRADDEVLADQIFGLNASVGGSLRIDDNTRLLLTGVLNGEKFKTYNGLSNLSGGLQAELQYRRSAAFDAVTWAAFARGWLENYDSHLRDGGRFALGVSAQGALTDRIGVYGELAWNRRYAQSEVWDLNYYSARLNLDYSLGRSGSLYLNGEYRHGTTVSDGHATLVNVSIAQVFVLDDAFPGKQLFAYRYDARTWTGTVGYNLPLGPRASLDVSWRRSQGTPIDRPDFDVQGSLRYVDNQYSLFFLKTF